MTCGIYGIFSEDGQRVYIGKSIDIEKRFHRGHLSNLRNNKHPCKFLQSHYNSHGGKVYLEILEECEEKDIFFLENRNWHWYKNLGYTLFNREPSATSGQLSGKHARDAIYEYCLLKEGIKYYCDTLAEFAREHDLQRSRLFYIFDRKTNEYRYEGFQPVYKKNKITGELITYEDYFNKGRGIWEYTMRVDSQLFTFDNIPDFSEKMKLNKAALFQLLGNHNDANNRARIHSTGGFYPVSKRNKVTGETFNLDRSDKITEGRTLLSKQAKEQFSVFIYFLVRESQIFVTQNLTDFSKDQKISKTFSAVFNPLNPKKSHKGFYPVARTNLKSQTTELYDAYFSLSPEQLKELQDV